MTNLPITKIVIITQPQKTDTVYFHTNLPPCIWPDNASPSLKLDVCKGKAEEYCRENFPNCPIEIIKGA